MKQLFTILITITLSCCFTKASAQGWAWARQAITGVTDSWAVATDKWGNGFAAFVTATDATGTKFGTCVVPPSAHFKKDLPVVWVKYSPSGVPLWAGGTSNGTGNVMNITTDPSGNLIVFGSFTSDTLEVGSFTLIRKPGAIAPYFLTKISASGTVFWAISDGDVNFWWYPILGVENQMCGGVCTDSSGNIYITSSFSQKKINIGSTTLINTYTSGLTPPMFHIDLLNDVLVAKYSPAGVPLWASSFGGTDNDYGHAIAVTPAGKVYVAGTFQSPSVTVGPSVIKNPSHIIPPTIIIMQPLAYIASFSATTGAPLWAEAAQGDSLGTHGSCAMGLASDKTGNVYMTGYFVDTTVTFGATTLPMSCVSTNPFPEKSLSTFIVRYSPADAIDWSKSISSPGSAVYAYAISLALCGQVWVCGTYGWDPAIIGPRDTLLYDTTQRDAIFFAGYNLDGSVAGYVSIPVGGDDASSLACDLKGNIFVSSDYGGYPVIGHDTLKPDPRGVEYFYLAKYIFPVHDTVYAHNDTAVCMDTTTGILLKAPLGYSVYYWDDGSPDTSRRVYAPGTYYVYCVSCGVSVLVDTFYVRTKADTVYNRIDTTACTYSLPVVLNGPPGFPDYKWSTGSTANAITVTTPGIYVVTGKNRCDLTADTFHFTITKADTLNKHQTKNVCASAIPLVIKAPAGDSAWFWSTGGTDSFISVNISSVGMSGTYIVCGNKGCTTHIDTIHVTVMPAPVIDLGNDTAFCFGNAITLRSPQPPGSSYVWSSGSSADTMRVTKSGTYWLHVAFPDLCFSDDSIKVKVLPLPVVSLGTDYHNCTGTPDTLQSPVTYTAPAYLWNDGSTAATLVADVSGSYWLKVTDNDCTGIDSIDVTIQWDTLNFYNHDTAICRGAQVQAYVTGNPAQTYKWLPTAGIAEYTAISPLIAPDTSATYVLTTSMLYCPDKIDSFHIDVQPNPKVSVGDDRIVCEFDTLRINAVVIPKWYRHYIYNWTPATFLDNSNSSAVVFTPGAHTQLYLKVSTPAGCTTADSVEITVRPGNFATYDTVFNICPRDSVQFRPTGGIAYEWHPGIYLNDSFSSAPWAKAITSQRYIGIATSNFGCKDTVRAKVNVHPAGVINLAGTATIYPGESYQISLQTNCTYFAWTPTTGLDNAYISNPLAKPLVNTRYIVNARNEWGCKVTDSIDIMVSEESLLDLPNAFAPGNGTNKSFFVIKRGEAELKYFRIFNRWGNKVFETSDIDKGWDGTYNGVPQPFGVYIYQVEAATLTGKIFSKQGNVTLIR